MSKLSKLLVTAAILPGMMDAPAVLADDLDDKKDKQATEETVSSDALLSSLKTLTLTSTSVPEDSAAEQEAEEESVTTQTQAEPTAQTEENQNATAREIEPVDAAPITVRYVLRGGSWYYPELGAPAECTSEKLIEETTISGNIGENQTIQFRDYGMNSPFVDGNNYYQYSYEHFDVTDDSGQIGYGDETETTVTFSDEAQTLTFYYYHEIEFTGGDRTQLGGDINVSYVYEDGHEVHADANETVRGYIGSTLKQKAWYMGSGPLKEIFVNGVAVTDPNVQLMVTDQPQTIEYVFERGLSDGYVYVDFVDEAGNPIYGTSTYWWKGRYNGIDSFNPTDAYGELFDNQGYTFKEVSIDGVTSYDPTITFVFDENEHHVKYTFVRDHQPAEPITVRYVDRYTGFDIETQDTYNGIVGKTQDIAPKDLTDDSDGSWYEYVDSSNGFAQQTVTFSDQAQTIIYYYDYHEAPMMEDSAAVNISYVDEQGNPIPGISEDPKYGYIGDTLELTSKVIPGYTFKEVNVNGAVSTDPNVKVTYSDQEQSIKYVYTKDPVAAADVTVKHVEKATGVELPGSYTVQGNVGDAIKADPLDFDGYTFLETEWPTEATTEDGSPAFTENPQTVTHYYTRDVAVGADVTVQYVDKYGNKLADSETLQGNVGDAYTAKRKDIKGYVFSRTLDNNETGTFTDQAQTVTLVYELAPTTNNDDNQKDPAVVPPANNDEPKGSTTVPPVNNNQNGTTIVSGNSGVSNDVTIGQNNTQSPIVTAVTNNKQAELPDTHAERKSALPLALLAAGLLVSAFAVVIPNKKH